MVTYDFSSEDANPWSADNWSLTEQGKFLKRMNAKYGPEIGLRRAQQFAALVGGKVGGRRPIDPNAPRRAPYQVIIEKRIFVQASSNPPADPGLGFWAAGALISNGIYTLAVTPLNMQFPGDPTVDLDLASCRSAPTRIVALRLMSNPMDNTTLICTVTFAAGAKTGTFNYVPTLDNPLVVPAGTTLYLVAPLTVDPTFIGISIQFGGALT